MSHHVDIDCYLTIRRINKNRWAFIHLFFATEGGAELLNKGIKPVIISFNIQHSCCCTGFGVRALPDYEIYFSFFPPTWAPLNVFTASTPFDLCHSWSCPPARGSEMNVTKHATSQRPPAQPLFDAAQQHAPVSPRFFFFSISAKSLLQY